MKSLSVITLLFLVWTSAAQNRQLAAQDSLIGTPLEKVFVSDFLLNRPSDTSFRQKFLVIEFWATWCVPCLKAVPHLNKLKRQFAGADSLVFLSMTNEDSAKVARTLAKVSFETIVVSDRTETTHRLLNIRYQNAMGLPRTVLIDNKGTIVWFGSPSQLTAKKIKDFLNHVNIHKPL